ncbi:hypothetical protein CNMCM5793_006938 [Aspergillus hiratsukae]|uniref:Ankyrin repeat-containing domain protein n=1 Tax=Aspergillus hiratsukae TaxID=1194566 RepID=A0A8H6UKT6_9EURO|nr:hypothetical protein CNMCM5793_006938 [Aspergillus hiratsukae]KAF7158533.1 hypothetical protein CNMCM6106_005215 [Aspergillus hiratsukae]
MLLINLPSELIIVISEFLGPKDLNALVQTASHFANLLGLLLQDRGLADPELEILLWAAAKGNEEGIQKILARAQHKQINIPPQIKDTMLMTAVWHERAAAEWDKAITRKLIELGADVNAMDFDGRSALHHAVGDDVYEAGSTDEVSEYSVNLTAVLQLLLKHGAQTEVAEQNHGETPLLRASINGNTEAIRVLLDHGADITASDDEGCTALHLAAASGNHESVKLLIEKGANIFAIDHSADTPLDLSASVSRVRTFVHFYFDIPRHFDLTYLTFSDTTSLLDLPPELNLLISEYLWPGDINALAQTSRGAASFFDPLLQDRIAQDPQFVNFVLLWAAKNGRKETIDKIQTALQQKGTQIDPVQGARVVMMATRHHQVDLLDYLVRTLGADLSARVGMYTIWDAAYARTNSTMYTKPTTALHAAALGQNEAVTRRLLELGADVNALDGDGASPLHYAAHNPTTAPAVVRLLLKHGSKTEIADTWHGRPLHRAAGWGNMRAIELLLQYGADVAARGFSDLRPLHTAVVRGVYAAVVLLVEGGSDVNARTSTGWRPLDIAVDHGSDQISEYLKAKGAVTRFET